MVRLETNTLNDSLPLPPVVRGFLKHHYTDIESQIECIVCTKE